MDFIRLTIEALVISAPPLIHYALSKDLQLKEIVKAKKQYIIVFIIMSFFSLIGSDGDSFIASIISLIVYIFMYKKLVANKYDPKIIDFDSFDKYVAALAKKRKIKYPLPQTIIALHGLMPKIEDYETIPDWSKALKKYFDDIAST